MFLDQFLAAAVETEAADFRVHDFRQALEDFGVRHVDLVQQDPLSVLNRVGESSVDEREEQLGLRRQALQVVIFC